MMIDGGAQVDMVLFPNPNRDGLVNLVLTGLDDNSTEATVEVYDMFGKRVHSEQLAVAGEEVRDVLELDLATGMYMVNVTIDGHVISQRLIKQ
jgi:hypothetical protein